MDKKTYTAIFIIFAFALGYQLFLRKFFPEIYPASGKNEPVVETVSKQENGAHKISSGQEYLSEGVLPEEKTADSEEIIETIEEKTFSFETENVLFQFSNLGGGIRNISFKNYQSEFLYNSTEDYVLNILTMAGLSGLENLEYTVSESSFERIVLQASLKSKGLKIEKILETTDKYYYYNVCLRITNLSKEKFYMEQGPVFVAGTVFSGKAKKRRYAVEEATALVSGGEVERLVNKKIQGSTWIDNKYMWIGIQDPTFCFILMEKDNSIDNWHISKRIELSKKEDKDDVNQVEVLSSSARLRSVDIQPGEILEYDMAFYAGPKLYYHLASVNYDFKKIVDFGKILAPISRAIIWGLNTLYGLLHNYGICIIILTILIKVLLFPLTQASMKSMKKLKNLQPHMTALREQHKDDPQRMNKETMMLYKKHGVNPVGGCLPMFLQLPIFIALFKTLNNAVELKGASFLWISDLSAPDTLFHIGSFPVNILPLIMGLTQFISQKQTVTDQKQAQMMYFMTIFFMFIFYSMPSGLVLYWLISNILSIVQQSIINRKLDA